MNIPCHNPCISCAPSPIGKGIGPIDPANPFVNLSSEEADAIEYIGQQWFTDDPPLGHTFTKEWCMGICISFVSQSAADVCALQHAQECVIVDPKFPCTTCVPTPENPFPENPQTIFRNTPQSCTFNCPDGTPFTFTIAGGQFSNTTQLAADIEAYTYACNQAVQQRICIGNLIPGRTCSNSRYNGRVVVSSGSVALSFHVIGELPDGIMMSEFGTVAFFSGTPTIPGDYTWTVQAEDASGNTVEKVVTLNIFGVANVSLDDAVVGQSYSQILVTGGTAAGALSWSITAGELPDGLELNSVTGEIFGTPTTEQTNSFQVTVTDGVSTCSKTLGIEVSQPLDCPDWNLFSWGDAQILTTGTATGTIDNQFVIANFNGMQMVCANVPGNSVFISPGATPNQIVYNGAGCNCNVQMQISGTNANGGAILIVSSLFGILLNQNTDSLGLGTFDVPFALPDTGGLNDTITVHLVGNMSFGFQTGTQNVIFTFSNVP